MVKIMTKKLKNLLSKWNVLAIALVAMMSVGLSSCGGDDDDDTKPSDSIVGNWVGVDDDTFHVVFQNNGSGYVQDKSGSRNFNYTYDSTSKALKLWYVDSSTVYNYSVSRTGDTLMLTTGSSTMVLRRN